MASNVSIRIISMVLSVKENQSLTNRNKDGAYLPHDEARFRRRGAFKLLALSEKMPIIRDEPSNGVRTI